MISLVMGVLLCLYSSVLGADSGQDIALSRLSGTADMLVSIGEEVVGEPIAGLLCMQDTVSIDISLDSRYAYQLVMWTESTFNLVDFWLNNAEGSPRRSELSDHAVFSVTSDNSETWSLKMELLEGASCDTAYYAVAVLRRERTAGLI